MTCAFAVRGAFKKMPGVEDVDVSLNKGIATVKLKPGNTLKPEEFWQTVRKNGYTPKETTVLVRGQVDAAKFKVSGTNQLFDLTADPKNAKVLEELRQHRGEVTIRAVLIPKPDLKAAVPLQVKRIEPGQ